MPVEDLEETEIDDESDMPNAEEEMGDDEMQTEDDPYSINVEQALSKDIRGDKQPDPLKVDKAQRLGFDLGLDPATMPEKPQVTI